MSVARNRCSWRASYAIFMIVSLAAVWVAAQSTGWSGEPAGEAPRSAGPIVLVSGEVTQKDVLGHHDYLGGCKCLQMCLQQTSGVQVRLVTDGWPRDASVLDEARAVVFYTDGGGKQAFLASPERVAVMDRLAKRGAGLVFIHQAVDFPVEFAEAGKRWLGGIYVTGKSGRGHWPSSHVDFPVHPITRGVTPWEVKDGWLNGIDFVAQMQGITPLVWSGKEYKGSRSGLDADIVGWAYDRPGGGRSFSFTGLDAHSAWSLSGMRQLVVNGVLWSAGVDIPTSGAPAAVEEAQLAALQTPRLPK